MDGELLSKELVEKATRLFRARCEKLDGNYNDFLNENHLDAYASYDSNNAEIMQLIFKEHGIETSEIFCDEHSVGRKIDFCKLSDRAKLSFLNEAINKLEDR